MIHKKSILFFILLFYFGCLDNGHAPPPPFPMDSWFVEYSDSYTEDNFFGPIVYLDTLGVISVAFSGNNINGNIISFTLKGIQATALETENDAIPDYTKLQLDEEKINLLKIDGSDAKTSDFIVGSVTITVTD